MRNIFYSMAPALVVLVAASVCTAAHAESDGGNADPSSSAQPHAETVQQTASVAPTAIQHRLTRRDVYNQLIQAKQDGTLARLNALYYGP